MSRIINYFPDNVVSVYSLSAGTNSFSTSILSSANVYTPSITPSKNPTAGVYGAHGTQTLASALLFDCISPLNNSSHKGGVVVKINNATNDADTGHYTLHTFLSDDHDIQNSVTFNSLLNWVDDFSGIYIGDTKLTASTYITQTEDSDDAEIYYVVLSPAFLRKMFIDGHNVLDIPMHPVAYDGVEIKTAYKGGSDTTYTEGTTGGTLSLDSNNNKNWYGETRAMASSDDSETTITKGATITPNNTDGYTFVGYAKNLTDTPETIPTDTISFDGEKDVWYALFKQLDDYIITQAAMVQLIDRTTGVLDNNNHNGMLVDAVAPGHNFFFEVDATTLNGDGDLTQITTKFANGTNPSGIAVQGTTIDGGVNRQSYVKTWYGATNTGWSATPQLGFRLADDVWTATDVTVSEQLSADGRSSTATYTIDGDASITNRVLTAHYIQNKHTISVEHLRWKPSESNMSALTTDVVSSMNGSNDTDSGVYVYGDTARATCSLVCGDYTFVGYKYSTDNTPTAPTSADVTSLDGLVSGGNALWEKSSVDECGVNDTTATLFAVWVKTSDLMGSIVLTNVHNYETHIS